MTLSPIIWKYRELIDPIAHIFPNPPKKSSDSSQGLPFLPQWKSLVPLSLPQLLSRFHKPRCEGSRWHVGHVSIRMGDRQGWSFTDYLEKSLGSFQAKKHIFFPPPVGRHKFIIPQVWYWAKIKQEVVSACFGIVETKSKRIQSAKISIVHKVYMGLIIKGTIPRVPPFSLWIVLLYLLLWKHFTVQPSLRETMVNPTKSHANDLKSWSVRFIARSQIQMGVVEPKIGGFETPQNGWWKFHGKPY